MARAATTSDVFNAVAEPSRRALLDCLAHGELAGGALVDQTDLEQPSVAMHLRVLHAVGLVTSRRDGRQRFYRLEAQAMRPLHAWVRTFDRYFERQLERVKERAESTRREHPRKEPS